jgi:para-nitrobenzyl esterase
MRMNRYVATILIGLIMDLGPPSSAIARTSDKDAVAAPLADPNTLRHTASGDVIGFVSDNNTYEWRGIPFAQPPIADLRWRAPRPPKPWRGVRRALEYGSSCMQAADDELVLAVYGRRVDTQEFLRKETYKGSEDCLYLNIHSPRFEGGKSPTGTARVPVMVYIHGGGNIFGAGVFPGALAASQNVITVAMNYRLGQFGFFTHPALRTADTSAEDQSGNYGILDQIRALQWIRDNISAFGGDPHNITVFGISAGGYASFALLSSPKAAGLFQRAIPMSGVTWDRSIAQATEYLDEPNPDISASSGELLLQLLILDGKAQNRDAAKTLISTMKPVAIAEYLHSKSYADINYADVLTAAQKRTGWVGVVIRDGVVIPEEGIAASLTRKDRHNLVSVMMGTARDEDQPYVLADGQFAKLTQGPNGPEYRITDKQGYRLASEYMSLLWNADGAQERAAALVQFQPGQIFAYQLAWHEVQPWPGPDKEPRGAIHSQDLALIFGMPADTQMSERNYRYVPPATKAGVSGYNFMAKAMMSYWGEFAYTGNPGKGRHGELPEWQPWNPQKGAPKYMILDSPAEGGLRMSTRYVTKAAVLEQLAHDSRLPTVAAQCEFLAKLLNYSTNLARITRDDYRHFADGACVKRHP